MQPRNRTRTKAILISSGLAALLLFGGGAYVGNRYAEDRHARQQAAAPPPVAARPAPNEGVNPAGPVDPAPAPTPSAAFGGTSPDGPTLPEEVRTASLQTTTGNPLRLADFQGKPVVLELWASWCPSCRAQAPHMNALQNEMASRGVEFVALTVEDPATEGDKVRKVAAELGMTAQVGFIPRDQALTFARKQDGGVPVPQTLVIAPDGRIVHHVVGYDPERDGAAIREAVEQLLQNAPPPGASGAGMTGAPDGAGGSGAAPQPSPSPGFSVL